MSMNLYDLEKLMEEHKMSMEQEARKGWSWADFASRPIPKMEPAGHPSGGTMQSDRPS